MDATLDMPRTQFGYDAVQAPDGTWTIRGLPIMSIHVDDRVDPPEEFGADWLEACLARAKQREAEGYLGPIHFKHHPDPDVEHAGHFRCTEIALFRYEGKEIPTLFADYVGVPDKQYQRMRRGEFPYRSVEIPGGPGDGSPGPAEILSVALLDNEVPFFRYPNFRVARERKAMSFRAYQLTPKGPRTRLVFANSQRASESVTTSASNLDREIMENATALAESGPADAEEEIEEEGYDLPEAIRRFMEDPSDDDANAVIDAYLRDLDPDPKTYGIVDDVSQLTGRLGDWIRGPEKIDPNNLSTEEWGRMTPAERNAAMGKAPVGPAAINDYLAYKARGLLSALSGGAEPVMPESMRDRYVDPMGLKSGDGYPMGFPYAAPSVLDDYAPSSEVFSTGIGTDIPAGARLGDARTWSQHPNHGGEAMASRNARRGKRQRAAKRSARAEDKIVSEQPSEEETSMRMDMEEEVEGDDMAALRAALRRYLDGDATEDDVTACRAFAYAEEEEGDAKSYSEDSEGMGDEEEAKDYAFDTPYEAWLHENYVGAIDNAIQQGTEQYGEDWWQLQDLEQKRANLLTSSLLNDTGPYEGVPEGYEPDPFSKAGLNVLTKHLPKFSQGGRMDAAKKGEALARRRIQQRAVAAGSARALRDEFEELRRLPGVSQRELQDFHHLARTAGPTAAKSYSATIKGALSNLPPVPPPTFGGVMADSAEPDPEAVRAYSVGGPEALKRARQAAKVYAHGSKRQPLAAWLRAEIGAPEQFRNRKAV